MTALDDALDEGSVTFGTHQIKAYWRESDGAADGDANVDTPTNLTEQFAGELTISHSFSDGLPDPVTLTGNADAVGTVSASLKGREGLTLATSGLRTFDAAGGSWDTGAATTTLTAPIPLTAARDDFIVAAILLDDATATLAQDISDPKDAWDFIGSVADGSGLALHVYAKRRWRTGNPQLQLLSDIAVDYVSSSSAFWARNPTSMALDFRVTGANLIAEAASTTSHSVTSTSTGRGYHLGFWGSASAAGAITPGAGLTSEGAPSGNGLLLRSAVTALTASGITTLTATQTPANAVMVMAGLSIEPYARPAMDARQYFSPFNRDSPVYGWERDTADVTAAIRTLTSTGAWDTVLFDGQMMGIPVVSRSATLQAASKARIWLNRSITLPRVSGYRENCTVDWLATYLMARGGSFVGPAPSRYTRYWAPMYGSVHAHWDSLYGYNAGFLRDSANPMLTFGLKPPRIVVGHWATAMYGQQTTDRQEEVYLGPGGTLHQVTTDDFPHLYENGGTGPLLADFLSLSNSKGRLQLWIRGDACAVAPAYLNSSDDFIFKMAYQLQRGALAGGGDVGIIECGIASNSRNPFIKMGNGVGGYTSVSFVLGGLPTDGNWHFVGFYWDFAAGSGNATLDGSVITSVTWNTNGNNDTSRMATTEEAGRARGDQTFLTIKSHAPVSDLILDTGETYVPGSWANHYPTPQAPGANATYRSTYMSLKAIAEPTAVNAWDTLADLARSALAWYRCDEADAFNFLPLRYFGETAQMTPATVQDTAKNSTDFDLVIDSSRIRNVVTVKFPDTRVDTQVQPVLEYLAMIEVPKGVSFITFPLDLPTVELHGELTKTGPTWEIVNLTSSQITTPNPPKSNHYISVNTREDGTGTVLGSGSVKGTIVTWDAMSVTVRFQNFTSGTAYLANNGEQVPFVRILGYAVRASDAYTTVRDSFSVAARRERALDVELPWVQSRPVAEDVAMTLTNVTSRPRPVVRTTVLGDPRREPGDMVTLLDKDGTQVEGNWRLLSVEHEADGPRYTQDITLVEVGPEAVWDDPESGWDVGVWGE